MNYLRLLLLLSFSLVNATPTPKKPTQWACTTCKKKFYERGEMTRHSYIHRRKEKEANKLKQKEVAQILLDFQKNKKVF